MDGLHEPSQEMVDGCEVEWLRKSSKVRGSKEIVSLTRETSTNLVSLSHSFERIKIWVIAYHQPKFVS
jgi:hypothetical protein